MGKNLNDFVEAVRNASNRVGALVIDTAVEAGKRIPTAVVDQYELVALIEYLRPRLVYLMEQRFNHDGFFEDKDIAAHSKAKALARQWRKWDGQVARVSAVVISDGVLHGISLDADWFGPVETEANALVEELGGHEQVDQDYTAQAAADRRIIESKAKELLKDPRFGMPKATKAKRRLLAESLFPDVEHRLLWAIVERTEAMIWLDGAS